MPTNQLPVSAPEPVTGTEEAPFWQLVLGADAPPVISELRAGPIRALLDGIELRYVRLGEIEILRRVYVAVRDPLWATVPGLVRDLVVDQSETSFAVNFEVGHDAGDIEFAWHGLITGDAQGSMTISMSGRAGRDLVYNRIGICVLLPPNLAGREVRAQGSGTLWEGRFPDDIGPQRSENGVLLALHPAAERLEIDLGAGGTLELNFAGDLFETEDQRNWTDASFKVYSTPLALGLPRHCVSGARIEQQVALRVAGAVAPSGGSPPLCLELGGPTGTLVPTVGLGLSSPPTAHSPDELSLLAALAPAHLRFDCHLDAPSWRAELELAATTCAAVGAELELALFCRPGASLDPIADALAGVAVARMLVFFDGAVTTRPEETTPDELVQLVRARFQKTFPIVAGTDLNFCELNRTRPGLAAVDGLVWPMSPQVHAFDDASIIETPEAQAAQVATAHHFAPQKPLFVGPVTLLPRYNPNAADHSGPSPCDRRQATLLAAAFTLSSLKRLAEGGVQAVTYYETVGERGVVARGTGAAWAVPAFHVLAAAARLRGAQVLAVTSTNPLAACAIAARAGDETTVLVANTTARELATELLGTRGPARIRRLNAASAARAGLDPVAFRSESAALEGTSIVLGPYETAQVEFAS